MNRPRRLLLSLAGVALLSSAVAAGQTAKPAVTPPPASTQKPADEGASKKLVAPVRGEALIGYLTPVTKSEGNMIVTTIRIKNLSSGAIAGLKVDEFWFDKDNQPVTGAQTFRYRKPLQPGEVIDVVLKVPRDQRMNRNTYQFEHANGKIKTQQLKKL
jgi:hypothetical protein